MLAEPDNLLKALADPTRRRILQVLAASELGVNDLVTVLHLPQSTVSRQLKTLRDAGLVDARHERTSATYFPLLGANGDAHGLRDHLLHWLRDQELPAPLRMRLRQVLRSRQTENDAYFARVANHWDRMRTDFFGPSFHLEALTALLPSTWTVADMGTGTGYLLPQLAAAFTHVHAVDPVAEMLEAARSRVALAGLTNVEFHAGTASAVPLPGEALDLCVASLVLHHEPEPAQALCELHRVLRRGGRLLIIEQSAHHEQAFHDLMQDRWWGFEMDALAADVTSAGFIDVRWRMLATAEPANASAPQAPQLFVMTATRPADETLNGAQHGRYRRSADDDGWRQY
ncbi:MAG: metalloregulator ArsR/SmtB family transcription factor [Phycisphaerales bacterium]|nr:metalloregulator ArsR/SmtB family transcription factor [Phycisphaerales bacterium]